jgi:hypothetical protein
MGIWMNARGNLVAWADTFSLMSRASSAQEGRATPADGNLLDDFESPQEPEILLKRWQISTDAGAAGHSFGELEVLSPGAAGTAHALRFKGHVEPAPGADHGYVAVRYTFSATPRDGGPRGIQFEVRGDRRLFQVKIEPPTPAPVVPALNFVPDSNWQTVRLPAAWLAKPGGSSPSGATWVLEILVDGPPGDFKLDLDELRLY